MTPIRLRRNGERPLSFAGATLARTVFPLAENGAITLGLYTCAAGGLICEYACQPPEAYIDAAGFWPLYAAEFACTADAAATVFESFSPCFGGASFSATLVRLAMEACLRAATREAVGEFLYSLALL